MKSYKLLLETSAFEALPSNIQTNQEAIEFAAKRCGIEIKKGERVNWHKLKKDLARQGVMAITCDDVAFFPRGKVLTIAAPKQHEIDAQEHKKKEVALRVPRARARRFVNDPAFAGDTPHATAAG